MDNIYEIKRHIKRIGDTEKVTHAMYLISSAKYRKAKEKTIGFLPYFSALEEQVKAVAYDLNPDECPFINKGNGPDAYLVITSDKGLAGDFNKNILNTAYEIFSEKTGCSIFVIGKKGKSFFEHKGVKAVFIEEDEADNSASGFSEKLYDYLSKKFLSDEIGSLSIIYYGTADGIRCAPKIKQVFPVSISAPDTDNRERKFEYIPDEKTVIGKIIPQYIESCFYSVIIQSDFSEQNLRMVAMDSANSNAGEMLSNLNLQYNHMRQNAITQEISEISGEG